MVNRANYISRWAHLIENFQASSLEFYDSVERSVQSREVPDIHWTRVEHKEAGLASANRLYLRMHRGKFAFDICAAQFGNGFFISWWLTEPPLKFGFLYTLAFLAVVMFVMDIAGTVALMLGIAMFGPTIGIVASLCSTFLGVPALLWVFGNTIRNGGFQGESTVLAMPLIGWIYERIFAPPTYYSLDTANMFQESVHNAVLEVLDCMTSNKGVRALSENERKPIMKKFTAFA